MTTELEIKTYPRLDSLISRITNQMHEIGGLIQDYYEAAKEEGLSVDDAKKYARQRIPNATFYRHFAGPKDQTKQAAGRLSHKNPVTTVVTQSSEESSSEFDTKGMGVVLTEDDEPTSSSESATGPTGEEVEQEVEVPKATDVGIETITIPKVEHEEHLQTIRELSKPILASQYKTHTLSQTYAYHQQIPKILKSIKETGAELGLIFHWTSDGYLKECEPWNNGTTTTKQENSEESD